MGFSRKVSKSAVCVVAGVRAGDLRFVWAIGVTVAPKVVFSFEGDMVVIVLFLLARSKSIKVRTFFAHALVFSISFAKGHAVGVEGENRKQ